MEKIRCLVLDHDDTVVCSTPTIHYPAFVKTMELLRPGLDWTLEDFVTYNFDPGFESMCRDMLQLTPDEMAVQDQRWRAWTAEHIPPAFEGIDGILRRFREDDGYICVVSHSDERIIRRDYRSHFGFEPDLVFGWDLGPDKRKPASWPLDQIMRCFALEPGQLLMVDDLKPGWQMARSRDVPFAFAGWGCEVRAVREFMAEHADFFLSSTQELGRLIQPKKD